MEEFAPLNEPLRIVALCGGYGTRMWPMSRQALPKQFQPLLGDSSFFENAISRVKLSFKNDEIFVAVSREHAKLAKSQAPGIPDRNVIVEPERRDTLGAVSLAVAYVDKYYPNSLITIIWGADHLVKDEKKFNQLIRYAAAVCQNKEVICKVDVEPPYPSTAHGWIKMGKKVGTISGRSVYEFEKYVEKPNLETAKRMFSQKGYLINTGYFVSRTSIILSLLEKCNPECFKRILKIRGAIGTKNEASVLEKEYAQIEKTSFDYGFFEKVPPGSMMIIPSEFGWHDVGTWDLLYEALATGKNQNVVKGDAYFAQSQGNLVYLPKDKIAAVIGVDNLVIVDTPDGLLVCQRGQAGEVKKFVEKLKSEGKATHL